MPGLGSPYFQHADSRAGAVVNVTTQLESATYLDCHVNRLGGKTVRIYTSFMLCIEDLKVTQEFCWDFELLKLLG